MPSLDEVPYFRLAKKPSFKGIRQRAIEEENIQHLPLNSASVYLTSLALMTTGLPGHQTNHCRPSNDLCTWFIILTILQLECLLSVSETVSRLTNLNKRHD